MKFKAKYTHIMFGFLMSSLMTFIMSGVLTIYHASFVSKFFSLWMHSWFLAFLFAFPTVLIVAPIVRKLLPLFVEGN